MSSHAILIMGEALLQESALPVTEFATPELYQLISDLKTVMAANNGAGLAAPQIGVSKRVIIFGGSKPNPRYPGREPVPFTVLINPEIEVLSDKQVYDWEGCLSVPGLRALIGRPEKICYTGFDPEGDKIERTVDGFHARVVQHELDHLNGILFPQRVEDWQHFGYESVLFPDLPGAKV